MRYLWLVLVLSGCTTSFLELKGECVIQQWRLIGYTMRTRTICDLPSPAMYETQVRDRDQMNVNPFPNLWDFDNKADTTAPNLLEEHMKYPPEEE